MVYQIDAGCQRTIPGDQKGQPQLLYYEESFLPPFRGMMWVGEKVKVEFMEKLPFTLFIYKKVDGMDTVFMSMEHPLVGNPPEATLGVRQFGRY